MRRILRYLWNALTLLSLLLCVATVVLWVRSHWVASVAQSHTNEIIDAHAYMTTNIGWSLDGHLIYYRDHYELENPAVVRQFRYTYSASRSELHSKKPSWVSATKRIVPNHFAGIGWNYNRATKVSVLQQTGYSFALVVPYWVVAVGFLLPAIVSMLIHRKWFGKRFDVGLCSSCGYDLRATPDRCPECGTISTKATS